MACAIVLAPMHFHADNEAYLDAFLDELDTGMRKVLEDLLKVHTKVEMIESSSDAWEDDILEEDDNPWQVS